MPKLKKKALVGIVMGSDSDLPIMTETARMLQQLGVPFDIEISSAHRSPERTADYARSAAGRGLKVIVVGAGGAAHLAGVIAAETTLPVIGVPIASSPLGGTDALFSTVQMPGGVPVATMAVGKAGAMNAAIFAAQIMATSNGSLNRRLAQHKREMARAVAEKSKRLKRKFRL
ncbi:MAG: 5-(carboxyamino)imidazole ribonucleotide mutase [Acidobacteria bacterium]|nr:5-(carboxyamino)imidazole ribonucleotide mutase [Acidobacteriota bacterium]MCZ6750625.1 5-(carboxyamino)imidazole ribonucleotide mutase [Acidobacteriota bacterium]